MPAGTRSWFPNDRLIGKASALVALGIAVGLAAAPAVAAPITEAESEPTADSSTSVVCPDGTHVISGGGEVLAGSAPFALTKSFKKGNGWQVSAYSSTSLVAYAYCSKRNYDLVTRRTDWVMTSDPLKAKCPRGTHIVSGGAGIQNGKELGGLAQTMRTKNAWVADANGIGPHSARAYCTAKALELDWSTAPDQPSGPIASAVCESGIVFSGGGSVSTNNGAIYGLRRGGEALWNVGGFEVVGTVTAQAGCH